MVRDVSELINIMGIPFNNLSKQDLIDNITASDTGKNFIVTANPEIVMEARNNLGYKNSITKSDYIIADGIGIIIASKLLKQPLPERIPGYELMMTMIEYASKNQKSCYFLGASEVNRCCQKA